MEPLEIVLPPDESSGKFWTTTSAKSRSHEKHGRCMCTDMEGFPWHLIYCQVKIKERKQCVEKIINHTIDYIYGETINYNPQAGNKKAQQKALNTTLK